MSVADELRRLAELHTAGSLTDTEFAAAKAYLLNDSVVPSTDTSGAQTPLTAGSPSSAGPGRWDWRSARVRIIAAVGAVLVVCVAASVTAAIAGGEEPTGSQARPSAAASPSPSVSEPTSPVVPESTPPVVPETASPAVPEPNDSDFRAVAIYTIQTETKSFAGASDGLVRELLQLTCGGLLVTDGRNVDDFGFEMGEVALDGAGVPKAEYPIFMRAATAFCPKTLDAVAARYGPAN